MQGNDKHALVALLGAAVDRDESFRWLSFGHLV
jgi:hypothetical protein